MSGSNTRADKPWSPKAQAVRRAELAALIRTRFRPLLDDQARSDRLVWWDQDRVALWAANAFFIGDRADVAFANTILRYVRDVLKPQPGPNPFSVSAWAGLLKQYARKLDADTRAYGLQFLRDNLSFGCTADYQFHGYNDNMPVMWSWALTAGGELLGEKRFTEVAWANLNQLKDLLRRRGTVSEYGMGYSTHRLTGIAHIASLSANPEFRALAKQIEARLWAELAGHWSPVMAQFCGASMRGGAPWQPESGSLMRQVFGDDICIPALPWRDLYEGCPRSFVKEIGLDPDKYLFAYAFGYGAEFAAADYHVPDRVAELFYSKAAGFTFQCSAETGYVNSGIYCKQVPVYGTGGVLITAKLTNEVVVIKDAPELGAQPHHLTTYHGANYALGSSTSELFGTSHAFRCSYRRRSDAQAPADYGDVLIRYNINDKVPGGRLKNRYWKAPDNSSEGENYNQLYVDQGTHHCLQHKNTVMCLDVPHYLEHWDIRSLRTELFFHQKFGKVKTLYVAGQRVTAFPFTAPATAPITIDDGAVFMAVHPLIGRHLERTAAMVIDEINEFLVISLYNYAGPSRNFTPHDLPKLGNGFVFEIRDAAEVADFAAFQAEMASVRILDQLYGGRRRVHYARPGLRLSSHFCPYTKTVMYDSVNGLTAEQPQFRYSTGAHKRLPFLDGTPAVGFEDWDWIETQMGRPIETYNPRE